MSTTAGGRLWASASQAPPTRSEAGVERPARLLRTAETVAVPAGPAIARFSLVVEVRVIVGGVDKTVKSTVPVGPPTASRIENLDSDLA